MTNAVAYLFFDGNCREAATFYSKCLGAELFLARTAIVLSIIGATWFLGGTERLRVLAFPLFLLFFMVPIPAIIYNQITFPLQLLASRSAEWALMMIGIPVLLWTADQLGAVESTRLNASMEET